ncbi:MAG: HAD family phosphatase [Bacteroidota bacterium]|nr:HAD family phosphatase [Bacteroidota bacterium]
MQKKISNIIFDFGGVILDINPGLTEQAFHNLGLPNFNELYTLANQVDLFDYLEKGLISPNHFYSEIRKISGLDISDKQIMDAWNSMLLDIPPERVELLLNLKSRYRTFLLSNTNQIHYEYYSDNFQKVYGYCGLSDLFEKDYYSFMINMRKPDVEIFEYVLNDMNLKPEETIFIDDAPVNIEAAIKTGIDARLLPKGTSLNEFIRFLI